MESVANTALGAAAGLVSQAVEGDSRQREQPLQPLEVPGDVFNDDLEDGFEPSAALEVSSDDQLDLSHISGDSQLEQEHLQSDDEGVSHPAALQLENSPLFRTERWGPLPSHAGATCSICLAQFEAEQEVTKILRCSHRFHLGCLRRWMEAPPFSCPMCRADASALQASPAAAASSSSALRHGWQPVPRLPLRRPPRSTPSIRGPMSACSAPSRSSAEGARGLGPSRGAGVVLVGGFGRPIAGSLEQRPFLRGSIAMPTASPVMSSSPYGRQPHRLSDAVGLSEAGGRASTRVAMSNPSSKH